jgi:Mce-associated membrane protein
VAEHVDTGYRKLNGPDPAEDVPPIIEGWPDDAEADTPDQHVLDRNGEDDSEVVIRKRLWGLKPIVGICLTALLALSCLVGWLAYRMHETHQAQTLHNQFIEVARQGALNLTTIDYAEVDTDVRRILDSSTGAFHDDFQQRYGPFVDVVKQAQSKTEGTVTASGLESQKAGQAQVLVVVSVRTFSASAPEQDPRVWRMRINVQRVGDEAKMSDVQFVP